MSLLEIDGPALAFFKDRDEKCYFYEVHALISEYPGELLRAYFNWRAQLDTQNGLLVWRRRPVIEPQNMEDTGLWKIALRYVVVPMSTPCPNLPLKLEGEEVARV